MIFGNIITNVGQNRKYTPNQTVYLVISLPKIPFIHRIYMVLANPNHHAPVSVSLVVYRPAAGAQASAEW